MKHFQYVSSLPLDPLVAKKKKKVVKASYYPFLLWKSLMVKRKLEHVYLQGCLVGEKSFQILNIINSLEQNGPLLNKSDILF